MIYISGKLKLPPERVPSDLRRYGEWWCRVWPGERTGLFTFAAATGIPAKFCRGGEFLVPADMRERLVQAGAEPSY